MDKKNTNTPGASKTLIDVEVLDFGPLYKQAVDHYISLKPDRASWPQEKRDRIVIRTECKWGRVNIEDQATFLLNEKGEGPKTPLSDTNKAYVALYAEMKAKPGVDNGFFEQVPFCKVPIDLNTAKTLRSIGIVALEDFIKTKIPEMEAAYREWRSALLEARTRILSARSAKQKDVHARPTEIQVENEGEGEKGPRVRA